MYQHRQRPHQSASTSRRPSSSRQAPDPLRQKRFRKSQELRDVYDRFPGEARLASGDGNIARRAGQAQVRCDGGNDDRLNPALIEIVGLNDLDRAAGTGETGHEEGSDAHQISPRFTTPPAEGRSIA